MSKKNNIFVGMRILTLILCFAFLTPGLLKFGYFAYFNLNQSSIIENHCVNKSKPELKCDGKCHLRQQIAIIDDITEPIEKSGKLPITYFQFELPVFFWEQALLTISSGLRVSELDNYEIVLLKSKNFLDCITPPPKS